MKQCLFSIIFLSLIFALTACTKAPNAETSAVQADLREANVSKTEIVASLNENRASHSATVLPDGKVIIIGGLNSPQSFLSDAEIFNPETNQFSLLSGKMNTPRAGHTATLLPDGKILIVGGWSKLNTAESSAELYDPQADVFAQTGAMAHHRAGHVAVRLENGKVLIVGGVQDGQGDKNEAELYDPKSRTFSAVGKLSRPRDSYPSVQSGDGRVLMNGTSPSVASGGSGAKALPSAEVFHLPIETQIPEGADQTTTFRNSPDTTADDGVLIFGGAAYLLVK